MADSFPDIAEVSANADAQKNAGNVHFKGGHYKDAICSYASAIDLIEDLFDVPREVPTREELKLHVYYTNRAFSHIKMENFGSAIVDSTEALRISPSFAKAYYRRGVAKYAMTKYREALKDFKELCKLSPTDRDARAKLKECDKIVQEERFAAAIASDNTKPYSETIDWEKMPVDAAHDGPVYTRGERPTPEWAMNLSILLKERKLIHKRYAYGMVLDMIALLKTYSTVGRIDIPDDREFTVCGDIHGQYYDLLNIWDMNGYPSENNPYLFNGDFVDRGSFSIEVILSLFAWKLCYPNSVHLARGNHETKNMNKLYGFEGESTKKYDEGMYHLCCEAFCLLPLAHVLRNSVFVVHGGLFSKDNVTLDELTKIDRVREPPEEGFMTEMLWSDPQAANGRAPSKRGVGVAFGPDVTENFLRTNGLSMIVRSHEMKEEGYEVEHNGKCVTIFSAPNYCDQMGNKGAYIRFDGKSMTPQFTSFTHVPHPPVRAMEYANPMLGQMMMSL